jgi:Nuclear pore protein 84 / 107
MNDFTADRDLSAAEAAAAADALLETVNNWTSPKLGSVRNQAPILSSTYRDGYEDDVAMDPVEWVQMDDDEYDDAPNHARGDDEDYNDDIDNEEPMHSALRTPRRNTVQRADTPVMSNSSNKRDSVNNDRTTPSPAFNVQSPWVAMHHTPFSAAGAGSAATPAPTPGVVLRSNPSANSTHAEYRHYHDITAQFLRSRGAAMESAALEQRERSLLSDGETLPPRSAQHVSKLELKVDLEFLSALTESAWGRAGSAEHNSPVQRSARREGKFWKLLQQLRCLGPAFVLWEDDDGSRAQHRNAVSAHLQALAMHVDWTPAALLQAACDTDAPQALRRRRALLRWLEQCFENALPADVWRVRSARTTSSNSSHLIEQGLYGTNKDSEIFRNCLALILAGRLQEALKLTRDSGVSWRAAQWGGGEPHGYVAADDANVDGCFKSTGNPRRALWRRMMWKLSDKLYQDPVASKDEAAIAALLASNCRAALDNAALRSWDVGLYATLKCVMDRTEDELLHLHNNNRRARSPPYPGTDFEDKEREQLRDTAEFAFFDETEAIRTLACAPDESMQSQDLVTDATAAVVVGKSEISKYMDESVNELNLHLEDAETHDITSLRFATHLAIYLDQLTNESSAMSLPGASDWKDLLLYKYVNYLASREDLWYMIVLYASLLSSVDSILEVLPTALENIEGAEAREIIVTQLDEYIVTPPDLTVVVLRSICGNVLHSESQDDDDDEFIEDDGRPTASDDRKMSSVLWFTFNGNHAGDALIAANALLRHFFLARNKITSARLFVHEVFPSDIVTTIEGCMGDEENEIAKHVPMEDIENALAEHTAFLSYVEAMVLLEKWQAQMRKAKSEVVATGDVIDKSNLTVTEANIAANVERRQLIKAKRKVTQAVVDAAHKAEMGLLEIFQCPGGWLSTTEDKVVTDDDPSEEQRRTELDTIRRKLLPKTVLLYHSVCMQTAAWISESLNDTAEQLGNISSMDALRHIDDSAAVDNEFVATLSPASPRFWTQKALGLAEITESATYNIKAVFRPYDYKILAGLLAETTVLDLTYAAE